MITINNQALSIDILDELEPYLGQFDQYVVRDEKLQACSPFRNERKPSFAVNLQNGSWIDSGATGEFHKGNLVKLLAFLREETYEDTAVYLLKLYSPFKKEVESLHLDMQKALNTLPERSTKVYTTEELQEYAFRHPYLEKRGISEEVQKLFRVGFDRKRGAVVMPWSDKEGKVVNIKFRSVTDKRFWYGDGQSIKQHLYGYNILKRFPFPALTVVESEIDCMRLWTLGYPAVALGTAHVSTGQLHLLRNTQVEEIIIATDNDSAGRACAEKLESLLIGNTSVFHFNFTVDTAKDISDLTNEEIVAGFKSKKSININVLK